MVSGWWWTIPLTVAAVIGLWVLGARRYRAKRGARPIWVGNSHYLALLPRYRQILGQYRAWTWMAVAGLAVMVLGTGVVISRPVNVDVRTDHIGTRDIVLCLDISGSMIDYDKVMIDNFVALLGYLDGERVGLVVWNQTAKTVFPLTDDYDLVADELKQLAKVVTYSEAELWADDAKLEAYLDLQVGTLGDGMSGSLIGDGLASCALQFDNRPTERSRSIILATDNQLFGEPLFTLMEAAEVVKSRDAVLDGLFADSEDYWYWNTISPAEARQEFETAVDLTGGLFFVADDVKAVERFVEEIQDQQIVSVGDRIVTTYTDRSTGAVVVTMLGFAIFALAMWRARA